MGRSTWRRTGALLASATLLAALVLVTMAATTSAASPKCGGEVATIVGTSKGETIVGTAKADVVVAQGGNDTVRGLGGADIICGGDGKDKLIGGPGNDRLDGGRGLDTCYQGGGRGALRSCELPAPAPAPPPAPAPVPDSDGDGFTDDVDACPAKGASAWGLDGSGCPKPPPDSDGDGFTDDVDQCKSQGASEWGLDGSGCPKPPPEHKVLAIAFTDFDGNHAFTSGDVLIAKLVDTNDDKVPSAGDEVILDLYPTKVDPGAGDFGVWRRNLHDVQSVGYDSATKIQVGSWDRGFQWQDNHPNEPYERLIVWNSRAYTMFGDTFEVGQCNGVNVVLDSPGDPDTPAVDSRCSMEGEIEIDDRFLDVVIYP